MFKKFATEKLLMDPNESSLQKPKCLVHRERYKMAYII